MRASRSLGLARARRWLAAGLLCLSSALAGAPEAVAQEAELGSATTVPCVLYPCQGDSPAAWTYVPPSVGPGRFGSLAPTLAAVVARSGGTWGIAVADVGTDEVLLHEADTRFTSGSLYKLGVLAEAHNQLDDGRLAWDERITLSDTDVDDQYGGSAFVAGASLPLADALDWMITRSDNGVALALVRRLGGLRVINDEFASLGMAGTRFDWDAWTTPRDQLVLFRALAQGQVVSSLASRSMLTLLARQQINDRIPGGLPLDEPWRVAHKTGNWENAVNDAGVVDTPVGAYILCIFGEGTGYNQASLDAFHTISDSAYEAFIAGATGETALARPATTLCLVAWPGVCAPDGAEAEGPTPTP